MDNSHIRFKKADVLARAKGNWREIISNLCGVPAEHLDGKGHPCPICQDGTDRFNTADDFDETGTCHCRKCKIGGNGFTFIGKALGFRFGHTLREVGLFLGMTPEPPRSIVDQAITFHQFAITENRLAELATDLGVAESALVTLQVGWNDDSWTFPEVNADGTVIGLNRRFRDGSKKSCYGHRRGIMTSLVTDGPIYCVEGGSDTAKLVEGCL